MKHSVDLDWTGGMSFETELNGHKLVIDADETVGGNDKGPRPKPLMLLSLAGCTGMDVVSILKKMRVEFDDLKVSVDGELSEDQPKRYVSMHVVYTVKGKNLPLDKIKKAVKLSEESYCGVSAVYKKAMQITSEIRLEE
ncbi:MAG: osmotically inducible protein C [Marinilabiliales bacterium]|nr:MAG: osmotically inducible protein C [Marinilabiliales bacterium]